MKLTGMCDVQSSLFHLRSDRDRDRDNRSERERIRLFREREERKHLMRKRHWLEVPSDHLLLTVLLLALLLTAPALGFKNRQRNGPSSITLLSQPIKFLRISCNFMLTVLLKPLAGFDLQFEKQRLDADRMERQFLERERLRIEYERRREQERIMREREELRRQQEQLRFEQERRPVKRPYDMDGR